ncbi:MAG: DUF1780 domain-containing protein [Burkholderiales bacterium]|nr:DUF1780 domain-containing protein [Burkholderiales bacterium]
MSQQSNPDQKFLDSIRRGLRESVAFWSPDKKPERETYVVRTLLQHLGIQHDPTEIQPEAAEPPDMRFRSARFEIKEILDQGRRRHDEYRQKLERAMSAKCPEEMIEHYTPQDLTFSEVGHRVVHLLQDISKHYAPKVIEQLDLLVYVNLRRRIIVLDSPVTDPTTFARFGWRSVSMVKGSVACVLHARPDAPDFLYVNVGKPASRPEM